MTSSKLDVALRHAGRGWPVFPVEPGGKRPLGRLVAHGLNEATTDVELIGRWWGAAPQANIGIRTGVAFDAVDLDGPDAVTALARAMPHAVEATDDQVVVGPTARTPRGWHVYVATTGRGNTTNLGGLAGVDWRGKGGYVVAPGSTRADGTPWGWYLPGDPLYGPSGDIRLAPTWLVELLSARPGPSLLPAPAGATCPPPGDRREAYGRRALDAEAGKVALAAVGTRNHTLNTAAYSLGQLAGGGILDPEAVVATLLTVAARAGLAEREAAASITSGLTAGMAKPRQVAL